MVSRFTSGAQIILVEKGHTFTQDLQVFYYPTDRRNTTPKALLTFATESNARAFYYTFSDYIWGNQSGSQTTTVRLSNPHFHAELLHRQNRQLSIQTGGISSAQAGAIALGAQAALG